MTNLEIGGSEGYEIRQLVEIIFSPDGYGLEYFPLNDSTDQEQNRQQGFDQSPPGTKEVFPGIWPTPMINQGSPAASGTQPRPRPRPRQRPRQQLGQPAGPSGGLAEPWINQGQSNQAAAATQSLIAQQHSGQSPGNSVPDSLVKKRGYDKKYRENQKKRKQERLDEIERLKSEKREFEEKMKSELEAFKAENGRLKQEMQGKEQQMKFNWEIRFEIKRLRDEVDSLKRDNACMNQRMQTQSTELAQLRNEFDELELKQQNQRTREKRSMSSSKEFRAQIDQEDDSVDSAQNIPIISAAKEAEHARNERIDEAQLNWQSQKWETLVAEEERWERARPGKFNQTDRLTEYETET